jgi:hypothetical protein
MWRKCNSPIRVTVTHHTEPGTWNFLPCRSGEPSTVDISVSTKCDDVCMMTDTTTKTSGKLLFQ